MREKSLSEKIATLLNVHRPFMDEGPNGLAEDFADLLAEVDPLFDRDDFLQDAGARDKWGNPI